MAVLSPLGAVVASVAMWIQTGELSGRGGEVAQPGGELISDGWVLFDGDLLGAKSQGSFDCV